MASTFTRTFPPIHPPRLKHSLLRTLNFGYASASACTTPKHWSSPDSLYHLQARQYSKPKMTDSIKTRLFLISDTHSLAHGNDVSNSDSFHPPFPASDVLIHAGDLTSTGQPDEYRAALRLLASIPAELKLVIAGNHDLSLDKEFYLEKPQPGVFTSGAQSLDLFYNPTHADISEQIWTGKEAKDAGVTYLTEGVHTFSLSNGARFTVYASPWQPSCKLYHQLPQGPPKANVAYTVYNWAFNYEHNEDRWNPPHLISQVTYPKPPRNDSLTASGNGSQTLQQVIPATRDPHPIPENVPIDIIVTHGPAWKHLDKCIRDSNRAGCPQLLQADERVRPKLHVCGHIHEGWGAELVRWPPNGSVSSTHPNWQQDSSDPLGESRTVIGSHSGGEGVQAPNDPATLQRGAAYVDVSATSVTRSLVVGEETLMVNASIKDIRYRSNQAGWLVDLDLPLA